MPEEHARLSPSAAKRWIACPASVRLAAAVPPEPDSPYAAEGTAAHSLAEMKASAELLGELGGDGSLAQWEDHTDPSWDLDEMHEYTDAYVELLRERLAAVPHSVLMLERRVNTGLPECWGTADAIIFSPEHIEVVDLKYGAGVPVSAYENPQLMLYGVGALDEYGDLLGETRRVVMTIFQPRSGDGRPSSFEMPADDLRAWRDSLQPVAHEAIAGSDQFGPSEEACRWCPVKGTCRARMQWAAEQDFGREPDLLTPDELGEVLHRLPGIKAWCTDVAAAAERKALDDPDAVPGWKVVASGGRRQVRDEAAALERMLDLGIRPRDVQTPPKLVGITALDKVLKPHGGTEAVLGDLVAKSEGKPSLVPADDPRPAYDALAAARKDFDDA